jgi:hypothetical protein
MGLFYSTIVVNWIIIKRENNIIIHYIYEIYSLFNEFCSSYEVNRIILLVFALKIELNNTLFLMNN